MRYGVTVARGTLTRLDRAFSAFYRRCSAGQKPGFPRFKAVSRFDCASYEDTSGWRLEEADGRLYLQGIGHVRIKLHRPLRGIPKTLHVRRQG
ncbi:MAG TPA: transposase, partial [Actinomycetota bacterium]|nr:transposase [Actinomycetota bacterium]